jgi:hypothetical protein
LSKISQLLSKLNTHLAGEFLTSDQGAFSSKLKGQNHVGSLPSSCLLLLPPPPPPPPPAKAEKSTAQARQKQSKSIAKARAKQKQRKAKANQSVSTTPGEEAGGEERRGGEGEEMRKNISDFSLLHFIKPHILIASIVLFSQRLENCSDETHVVPLLVF